MKPDKPRILKYILFDGQIRIGWNTDYHWQLLPKDFDREKIKGGGRVNVKESEKAILLYALSADFGRCVKEDLINALPNSWFSPEIEGYKVFWAPYNKMTPEGAWPVAEEVGVIPD